MTEYRCGHERTDDNTRYKHDKRTGRSYPGCKTCFNAAEKRRKEARRRNRPTRSVGKAVRSNLNERAETFPVEPLLRHVRGRLLTKAGERLVERARKDGRLHMLAADKIAIQLGTHPGLIWPEWWLEDELEESA